MTEIILTLNVERDCPFCNKKQYIKDISYDNFVDWQGGVLVQDAFPELTAQEREILISGICPDCFL